MKGRAGYGTGASEAIFFSLLSIDVVTLQCEQRCNDGRDGRDDLVIDSGNALSAIVALLCCNWNSTCRAMAKEDLGDEAAANEGGDGDEVCILHPALT